MKIHLRKKVLKDLLSHEPKNLDNKKSNNNNSYNEGILVREITKIVKKIKQKPINTNSLMN